LLSKVKRNNLSVVTLRIRFESYPMSKDFYRTTDLDVMTNLNV